MTNRVPLSVTSMDFDGIKQSLISFLKTQNSPIKDYNYEGSNFNIILDVLAANAHYQSLYSNFISNEMFLDSALLRSSVVSIGKELGYVPLSAKSSTAKIQLSLSPFVAGNTTLVVPANTKFSTNVNDTVYAYINLYDETLVWNGTAYVGEFEIHCGSVYTQSMTVASNVKMYIEADGVDTSTLLVTVQEDANTTAKTTYANFSNILDLNSDSRVYFLSETDLKRYEINFGDGIIGKDLVNGNVVNLRYLAVDMDAPYNATDFLADSALFPSSTITIVATSPSSPPVDIESVDSIRENIKRYNQSQDRSVISSDYEYHIKADFPDVLDCIVWGGETNNPPQYGKVFVSAVMKNLTFIPESRKTDIKNAVKKKNTMNVRPIVLDPEYLSIVVHGFVRYNAKTIGMPSSDLKNAVVYALSQFSSLNLERFNKKLALSKLSNSINAIDPAISSVVFTFEVVSAERITTTPKNIVKDFKNSIRAGTFGTTYYYKDGNISDTYAIKDVNGVLNEYKYINGIVDAGILVRSVGTIDYSTGVCSLSGMYGTLVDGTDLLSMSFFVDSSEIQSGFNQILTINHGLSSTNIEVRSE